MHRRHTPPLPAWLLLSALLILGGPTARAADGAALEILLAHNPKAKIIRAHTGFSTAPEKVAGFLERYPDHFLLGSDTWTNDRWDSHASTMAEYRTWLAQLPEQVAEKIGFGNADRLFKR